VRRIGDVLDNQDATSDEECRAANALAALANAYRGVSETFDMLPCLEALEAAASDTGRIVVEYVNAAAPVPLLEPLETVDRPGD
jgi:hypothetical protein